MKVDRYARDLFKKLEDYNISSGNGNECDDDYYLEIGSEPPRFADYRAARAKITDAFGNKTYEDVWDSITQDELDYYLKMNLRVHPEDRYQRPLGDVVLLLFCVVDVVVHVELSVPGPQPDVGVDDDSDVFLVAGRLLMSGVLPAGL